MRLRRLVPAVLLVIACALSGCADQETAGTAPAPDVPWLDADGEDPLFGALAVDPADGALWMATNAGLFRLLEGARRPDRVEGTLRTPDGSGSISAQLVVRFTAPGRMLASGHPGAGESTLPEVLGLIESRDAGRSWTSVSGLGELDFHAIEPAGDTLIASEFQGARVHISQDGGRTWETRVTPRVLTALAVDPADASRWVGTADDGIYLTADMGHSWRPVDATPHSRLAWPAADALYRLDPGGPVRLSADQGRTWQDRGSTGGEPEALMATDANTLHAALRDGTVTRSTDGGRTWQAVLAPPG